MNSNCPSRQPSPRGRAAGFTLIEVLVVLILVGLISAILMEGMEQTFWVSGHFDSQIHAMQAGAMATDWYRETVEGLQPDFTGEPDVFSGAARQFSGLTTDPLSDQYGAPLAFTISLDYDADRDETRLVYGTGTHATTLMTWPGTAGKFQYEDTQGAVHDAWPPPLGGPWPQLPTAILLHRVDHGGREILVATPMGPTTPLPRVQDLFGQPQ